VLAALCSTWELRFYCYSRLPEIKYRGFAISLLFANKVSARKFKSTVVDRTSPFLALLH